MRKITRLPYGWPTDNRTKRSDWGKWIVITHPDRQPHKSVDGEKWEQVKVMRQKPVDELEPNVITMTGIKP